MTKHGNAKKNFRLFLEAREYARSLSLKSMEEWKAWCRSSQRPPDIPSTPELAYAGKGWKGFGDWLGTGPVRGSRKFFHPFPKARRFARSLELANQDAWFSFSRSGKRPADIPSNPSSTYATKGWKGWGDWLGNDNAFRPLSRFRSYKKAREYVRQLKLTSHKAWRLLARSGRLPADIPSCPWVVYAGKGWIDMNDWLGSAILPRGWSTRQRLVRRWHAL